jgi:hypothetical protein
MIDAQSSLIRYLGNQAETLDTDTLEGPGRSAGAVPAYRKPPATYISRELKRGTLA